MGSSNSESVRISVVGVGGAGGNAVHRMVQARPEGLQFLAVNTDIQALRGLKAVNTFAIGPAATGGLGSGGNPEVGKRAMRESQEQVGQLLEGSDMVFVTAGMGGGTGTGAAPIVADIARKQGALTVGVVTRPFSFEGPSRRDVADRGLQQLRQKVDTLITVENDRLLSSLNGDLTLEKAFLLADEVLRQGVEGISDIITLPGLVNVDFADVRSVMAGGGTAFMAMGEGKGKTAAADAVDSALANPLFDAPLEGAGGVLLNVRGGKDLSLGQVQEIAGVVRDASRSRAEVIFGVVQDRRWNKRVSVTLVATGIEDVAPAEDGESGHSEAGALLEEHPPTAPRAASNGKAHLPVLGQKLL